MKRTMVFAFVQTIEKTAFLGLKQSAFTQSGLLTTVQIFVQFVQLVQKLAFAGEQAGWVGDFLKDTIVFGIVRTMGKTVVLGLWLVAFWQSSCLRLCGHCARLCKLYFCKNT